MLERTNVIGVLKSLPKSDRIEMAKAWDKGEIIPETRADAPWCAIYSYDFRLLYGCTAKIK